MKRFTLLLIITIIIVGCKAFKTQDGIGIIGKCNEKSTMIFFNKSEICEKLLFINYDLSKIDTINSNYDNSCGNVARDCPRKLAGYYIEPKLSDLNVDGNHFLFRPVWTIENATNIIEEVGMPIALGNSYESISTTSMQYQTQYPYSAVAIPNVGGFNHDIFMYNSLAISNNFRKAFISRHELLLITNSSDYVGIGGGLVVTDNLAVGDSDYRNYINETCAKRYFTYRFVGFKKQSTPYQLPVEKSIFLLKSGYDKELINGYNPAIPTETWAVPCPPMWDPTDD